MSGSYQREHLKSLTGLRFVAALSVFVAHSMNRWPVFDQGTLPFGAAGVSFFFLLSGFILTYVYGLRLQQSNDLGEPSEGNGFSFKQFYIRRLARIWPIHIATLLVSLLLVTGTEFFFRQENSIFILLANLFLVHSWIPSYSWIYGLNGPSWSLAVETFFYLVFPFLLFGGARQFAVKYVLIVVATIVPIVLLDQFEFPVGSWVAYHGIFHTNPIMRLSEFATGVGCGFWFLGRVKDDSKSGDERKRLGTLGELLAIGIVAGFFAIAHWLNLYDTDRADIPLSLLYWFRFSGAAPVFAVLVVVFSCSNGVISKFLSSRILVYLGEISYSFYMIHMPVMVWMMRYVWIDTFHASLAISLGCLGISTFLAALLYHLIELPFRKAIVGFSEGESLAVFCKEIFNSLFAWLRTPSFVITLGLAAAGFWLASSNLFDTHNDSLARSIVASSLESLKGIEFEADATLLGVEADEAVDGSIGLKLVWRLQKGRRAMRLLKLRSSEGKVLRQASQNKALFDTVVGEETVIDWVKVDPDKMQDVKSITVNFFDKNRKRPGSLRQLTVWERSGEAESVPSGARDSVRFSE